MAEPPRRYEGASFNVSADSQHCRPEVHKTMPTCTRCGGEIIFRNVGFQVIPIHLSGSCSGWGGIHRIVDPRHYEAYFDNYRWGLFPSYVNPNATCPVCGAAVYFYQSPYGGRVFFDELGPPWPKHPCTDSSLGARYAATVPSERSIERSQTQRVTSCTGALPAWFEEGWRPFVTEEAIMKSTALEVTGFIIDSAGRKRIKITCPFAARCFFERIDDGPQVGLSMFMNPARLTGYFWEGLVMLRYRTESTVDIDVFAMNRSHQRLVVSIE